MRVYNVLFKRAAYMRPEGKAMAVSLGLFLDLNSEWEFWVRVGDAFDEHIAEGRQEVFPQGTSSVRMV